MIEIYRASVDNVRELRTSRKKLKRLINLTIKNKQKDYLPILTKNFALLYSAFAETCFLKMIHTPHGFNADEIKQITFKYPSAQNNDTQNNLEEKWSKCLELAFKRINNNSGEFYNKKQTLHRLVQNYVVKPSKIRNKIAHGQWKVALNSKNSSTNQEATSSIKDLDFVKVDILFEIYEKIGQVVEDLIESPYKAHFNDYYSHLAELEELVEKTKAWTFESKTKILEEKFKKQEQNKKKYEAQ